METLDIKIGCILGAVAVLLFWTFAADMLLEGVIFSTMLAVAPFAVDMINIAAEDIDNEIMYHKTHKTK